MKNTIKTAALAACFFSFIGCFKDLDTVPLDPTVVTSEVVYKDPTAYKAVLAKLYAGFAVSGQQGPSGKPDISGIDEGFGQYLRGFWYHQELPTDEALIGWNDQTIANFHGQNWSAADGFIYAFYSRVFYQISLANEFLRETTDEKLAGRGVDDALKAEIKTYRAEARFLRALSYWHGLDMFRNVPFGTEADVVGDFLPRQSTPQELFDFLEKELKEIDGDLKSPRSNEYARADQAAAWMLLAKLYLNAEVYTGQKKYAECLALCEKLIGAGFALEPHYVNLFRADNHKSSEIIFPIAFDGVHTRTWGGMTFVIRAGIGGTMNPVESGVVSGWGGTRTTKEMIAKFPGGGNSVVYDFNEGGNYSKLYLPGTHQSTPFNAEDSDNSINSLTTPGKIYEGYRYFPANTELRFTTIPANQGPPQLGDNGADGSLETGGANIKIADAGFYHLTVDLGTKKYTITKAAIGIVGTATGGQEIGLTYDPADGFLKVKTPLAAGDFVFIENSDPTKTLGDPLGNAILRKSGKAIVVPKSGGFEIWADFFENDYTFRLASTDFDRRAQFYSDGQSLEIDDITQFTHGYAVNKFRNVTSDGKRGQDTDFPDTDFPMFRLGDVYLMAAECVLRTSGDKQKAADFVNAIRERGFEGGGSNFSAADMTLDLILDERARELYWECHRRTDLVRFGQFTDGSYKWAWKGNVKEGEAVGAFRNIFPIPSNDLTGNTNLKQNPGY